MALKLTINNIQADLGNNQALTLKQLNDFFNLEVIEATVSLPFDLPPTPNNKRIFGHANIPASTEPLAKELDATLEADGALVRIGKFVLDRYRNNFEGYFKADAGIFSTIKDSLIGEFVDDVIELDGSITIEEFQEDDPLFEFYESIEKTWYVTSGDPTAYYLQLFDGRFDGLDSNISFPALHKRKTIKRSLNIIRYNWANKTTNIVSSILSGTRHFLETDFIACVKLKHILTKIIASQGYETKWIADSYELNQAILIAEKEVYQFPAVVGSLLPEIKVSDFLNSMRKTFGLSITIDSKSETCTVRFMKNALASSEALDITDFMVPNPEIQGIETEEGASYAYSWDFDNKEARTGEKLAESQQPLFLPSEVSAKMFLNTKHNAYWLAETYTPQTGNAYTGVLQYWRKYMVDAELPNQLFQDVQSVFTPVMNRRAFEQPTKIGRIRENLIEGGVNVFGEYPLFKSLFDLGTNIRVRLFDLEEYGDAFHLLFFPVDSFPDSPTTNSPGEIRLLNFVNDYDDQEGEIYFQIPNENTEVGGNMEMPDIEEDLEGKALIAYWHGIQNGYRYASAGNFAPDETNPAQLCTHGLRWEGPSGIAQNLFSEFELVSQDLKKFTFTGFLPLSKALNFEPLTKIMIDYVAYLATSIELKYRNDRPNERIAVEIECRRV